MTCYSCEASQSVKGVLMCRILNRPADIKNCRWLVYEPGTDEDEMKFNDQQKRGKDDKKL